MAQRLKESADASLYDELLSNYRPELRPVASKLDKVSIQLRVALASIISLDSREQSLTSSSFITLAWNDSRLVWNVTDQWCPVDVRKFPKDTQVCSIVFNLKNSDFDNVTFYPEALYTLDAYRDSNDWQLGDVKMELVFDDFQTMEMQCFVMSLTLHRQSLFHMLTHVAPVVVLSQLNPFVLLLPLHHGERLSFSVSLLLSNSVFLAAIGDTLPSTTRHVSNLGVYGAACMTLSALTCLLLILFDRVASWEGLCSNRWLVACVQCRGLRRKEPRHSPGDNPSPGETMETPTSLRGSSDHILSHYNALSTSRETTQTTSPQQFRNSHVGPESSEVNNRESNHRSRNGGTTWPEVAAAMSKITFFIVLPVPALSFILLVSLIS
ncbi:acetylcholine receptor subunit epsilon [Aplysia californica]|uniref:Acetylcholine receptor subunit epsilon n=1 Tax=Aplysia californica TaxID=6500 RepID=A0ABM0JH79_APLCA|nr:acetylcholine receptor subunit epsilon [Aplysia californica]